MNYLNPLSPGESDLLESQINCNLNLIDNNVSVRKWQTSRNITQISKTPNSFCYFYCFCLSQVLVKHPVSQRVKHIVNPSHCAWPKS